VCCSTSRCPVLLAMTDSWLATIHHCAWHIATLDGTRDSYQAWTDLEICLRAAGWAKASITHLCCCQQVEVAQVAVGDEGAPTAGRAHSCHHLHVRHLAEHIVPPIPAAGVTLRSAGCAWQCESTYFCCLPPTGRACSALHENAHAAQHIHAYQHAGHQLLTIPAGPSAGAAARWAAGHHTPPWQAC
jgi:hypothetical protein